MQFSSDGTKLCAGGRKDDEILGKYIKELFLKVKVDISYKANYKAIKDNDVKLLQEALSYLEANPSGLTKERVCYSILKRLYSLVPNDCEECLRDMSVYGVWGK